jgi:hypothetical protein
MAKCPNGHESEWNDYCSACGAPMPGGGAPDPGASAAPDAAAAPSAPSPASAPPDPATATGETCPACGEPRAPGAPFCESCGHDYSSPTPAPAPAAPAPTGDHDNIAVIRADRAYFDRHSAESGLTFPDPVPAPLVVPLAGEEVQIGRRSQRRGANPLIDLSGDNEDPAVSHKHAVLRRTPSGWTVTDLGSTNGTRTDLEGDPITPGEAVPLAAGASIFIGAWSRLTLETR